MFFILIKLEMYVFRYFKIFSNALIMQAIDRVEFSVSQSQLQAIDRV